MKVYYNEIDPYCCQWLKNLISAGELPAGDVDCRSIELVQPYELTEYTQCHFFAGLGGWAYAARLAEWPEDKPLWTGSCPCQPFSVAGNQQGTSDERHLLPTWLRLIRACRPSTIAGEQVKNAINHGWLDQVADALEIENYTFWASVLPACAVGAPHERDRLWFMATDLGSKREQRILEKTIPRQSSFSWCQDVRGIEDLRRRSDLPISLLRSYRDGLPCGMEQVRAFGNAIVPQVAAEVLRAYLDAEDFVVRYGRLREMENDAAERMKTCSGARMGVDDAIHAQMLLLGEAKEKGLIQ